jgi:hypothetical protein
MTTTARTVACLMLAMTFGASPRAQEKPAAPVIPVKVQVVISRYAGDKKVSSAPYTLSANAGSAAEPKQQWALATLRMGAKVPVATAMGPRADGKPAADVPFNYQDVGTSIDCKTATLDDGRFRLEISVDDSSVYDADQAKSSDHPSFRSFRANDSLILKDGQSVQFTTATDKVSGEVTKIDVTLFVVK